MNVLIVDDQEVVIKGLLDGVKWRELGVDKVYTAANAIDARSVFETHDVDLVLCDIEMPVETGIDLFRWVKKQGIDTYFIFLTSHAEFSYAQEAIRLGAADYVIQPAPYSQIEEVVRKGAERIGRHRKEQKILYRGQEFIKQRRSLSSDAIRNLLAGRLNESTWKSLEEMGSLPCLYKEGVLVLVQIVRLNSVSDRWDVQLLESALENVTDEIFSVQNQISAVTGMLEDEFAILLQGREGEELSQKELTSQLQFLKSVCGRYFKFEAAIYFSNKGLVRDMAQRWSQLSDAAEDNVTLRGGIYPIGQESQKKEHTYRQPQMKYWKKLLKEGYPQVVEEEALALLERMVAEEKLDKTALRYFYQDFMQMIYGYLDEKNKSPGDMFKTAEDIDIYGNGTRSVQNMRELIHFTLAQVEETAEQEDPQVLIQKIVDYIQDNLEEDLRRGDIAEHVHLNRDYLSRLFSKEMGMPLKEYITLQKMKAAQSMLRTTNFPIGFIGAKMGYCNSSHFSHTYKRVMGRTPQEERSGK